MFANPCSALKTAAVALVASSWSSLLSLPSVAQENRELIQEIVITATKRDAPLQDLAGNTALLNQSEIVNLSMDHISEAINRLPGVNVQHANGQEHLTSIRSPVLTAGAGAGSFLYMEDGISLRSPGFANINGLFEAHGELAQRIEIVRGPGSALYGSNAVHGLVNVLTRDPLTQSANTWEVSSGSHNQSSAKLSMAQMHGSNAALGLNVTLKHNDGYQTASGYDQQKATLRFDHRLADGRLTAVLSGHNLEQETAGYIKGFEAYKSEAIAKTNPDPEAFRNAKALRGYLKFEHHLNDNASLTLTPYFRHAEMDFRMHFLPGQALEKNHHSSIGLQAHFYFDKNSNLFIAGVDTDYTKGSMKEVQEAETVFSFVQGVHFDYDIAATMVSPFIHSEWQASDHLRLMAGLRADYTNYNYENNTSVGQIGRYIRTANRSDDFLTLTPKLGLTYQFNGERALFGLYARGQRPPQTTDLYRMQINQVPGEAEPETVDSLELGLRDTIGSLRYEISAFYLQKEHFFFRDSDGWNVIDGKTRHRGVEAQFTLPLLDQRLKLSGSATYAIHSYDFDHAPSDISSGDDIDTAPRLQGNLRFAWTPSEAFRTELEWIHMDKYYTNSANTAEYEGHDLINLRASYQLTENLTLYGRIENLSDTAYAERADYGFGSHRYFPGETRSYFLGLRANF